MSLIIIEICKKELAIRFGSKASNIYLLLTLAIPMAVFLPQTTQVFLSPSTEYSDIKLVFFLIIPIMISNLIGISTFINEIRWKTIKTLLIAPIDMNEIFLGKSLACILAGIVTDLLLAGFLVINGISINISILMLFFVIGPLIVILSTFLLIIITIKYPNLAENGGSLYFSMGGLMLVFLLLFIIKFLLNVPQFTIDIIYSLIIGILAFSTFYYAKNIFNKDQLALSW